MRIERFIPFWAEELNSFTTPFEAGNGYNVKLDKVGFDLYNLILKYKFSINSA